MTLSRRGMLVGTAALMAATAVRASGRDLLHIEGPAFGARWSLRIAAGADSTALVEAVTGVVASVDAEMSPYRPDSALTRFNATQSTDWHPLPNAMLTTLHAAQRVAHRTGGAFDPTLGGVTGRYGFGPITGIPAGRFDGLALAPGGARKAHPRQTLDLCGIAKGHALDRAVAAVAALGHQDFLIEMGGEVRTRGRHPDGREWRVGVDNPLPGASDLWGSVAPGEAALATSGDRINAYQLGARRFGHIIDPRSGEPARSGLASVSVLAGDAMTADALATALFALGTEHGAALAQSAGIPALFLIRDRGAQATGLRAFFTGGFADHIVAQEA
ncbi:MAG: FAD:protein FMN transferase [Rhodobacteraceae bacterium]|nr:FAD:protein FMN transferase [Paracoccaceae bacterium]